MSENSTFFDSRKVTIERAENQNCLKVAVHDIKAIVVPSGVLSGLTVFGRVAIRWNNSLSLVDLFKIFHRISIDLAQNLDYLMCRIIKVTCMTFFPYEELSNVNFSFYVFTDCYAVFLLFWRSTQSWKKSRYSVLRKRKVNVVVLSENFSRKTILGTVIRNLKEPSEFFVLQFIVKNVCFAV